MKTNLQKRHHLSENFENHNVFTRFSFCLLIIFFLKMVQTRDTGEFSFQFSGNIFFRELLTYRSVWHLHRIVGHKKKEGKPPSSTPTLSPWGVSGFKLPTDQSVFDDHYFFSIIILAIKPIIIFFFYLTFSNWYYILLILNERFL